MRYTNVEQIPRPPRKRPVRVFLLPACAIALGTLGLAQLSGCASVRPRIRNAPFVRFTARGLGVSPKAITAVWDKVEGADGSWTWLATTSWGVEYTCSILKGVHTAKCGGVLPGPPR